MFQNAQNVAGGFPGFGEAKTYSNVKEVAFLD